MTNQKYRDLSLVFGAPSDELYEMLSGISDKVQKPFSEIYFEFLNDVLKTRDDGNLIEETLSIVLDEEIRIGNYSLTYQRWFEERDGFSKFTQNCHLQDGDDKFMIKIPVLMLYPDNFMTPCGNSINTVVETKHIEYLAAVIGKTIQLDWVQTLCTYAKSINKSDSS